MPVEQQLGPTDDSQLRAATATGTAHDSGFSLRVKPDRRRVTAMPPRLERRTRGA